MWCPHCGADNWDWRERCAKCGKLLSGDEEESTSNEQAGDDRDTKWEQALGAAKASTSDEIATSGAAGGQTERSQEDRWKFQLIPALAVVALLMILGGYVIMEVAFSEQENADSPSDALDAAETVRLAARMLEFGVILLAFVVAGISFEYRPKHMKKNP